MSTLIFIGTTAPLDSSTESAIDKQPINGPLHCGLEGLAGDQQQDQRHHGGLERALHYYPREHYAYWDEFWQAMELPPAATPLVAGAFGENLSDTGLNEEQINIGDIFTLGEAVLQVSQPRSPCFKLNIRFGYPQMSLIMQTSGRTGWLFRVLQQGLVDPDDSLTLHELSSSNLSVHTCLDILYNRPFCREDLELLAEHKTLSTGWKRHAANRLESGQPEHWSRRLFNRQ
ncbi:MULTISPECIES: MOSC domain-containing protein [Sedimenticola]|uniref:MOSC domain-containing protein n=1 Tax=Sedimenticola selenatireducens TaxID=191960 RepID=A0A2N6CUJ3_9GAMM|nr:MULTISPECIES: MOSC domain-containing protein [Sedimenticola]MCW8904700.1 MOSC domain-containing protein [Sedimenticola sp.]PLX60836.1 MAG: MOSC domain-containing protein [Sedimenticola selenatireducens]